MVKFRRELLVALVLICTLVANGWSVKAHAYSLGRSVSPQCASPLPMATGEPDVGQGKEPPKTPSTQRAASRTDGTRYMRWVRWTSGLLMARLLGVPYRF